MFAAHRSGWGFEAWSCMNLDAQTQPYAKATLLRVSASLAAWADTLPDDLLTLTPAMTPDVAEDQCDSADRRAPTAMTQG